MSTVTIRGNFVFLLAQVEDATVLQQMFEKCLEILKENNATLGAFSQDFLLELEEAIAQSDDETEAISNEDAFKLFRQWSAEK
jgi:hypothetical protein